MSDRLLARVSVITLGVRDIVASIDFYRDTLGLPLQSVTAELAFFDVGGVTIMLSQPLSKHTGLGAGATEIVFGVEHVKQTYELLRARKVAFVNEPRPVTGPMWAATFKDPDGHLLSLFGTE